MPAAVSPEVRDSAVAAAFAATATAAVALVAAASVLWAEVVDGEASPAPIALEATWVSFGSDVASLATADWLVNYPLVQ